MFFPPFIIAIMLIFGTKLASAEKIDLPTADEGAKNVSRPHSAGANSADANASYLDSTGFTCFKVLNKCFKASFMDFWVSRNDIILKILRLFDI
jgi:hypothetical protein